MAVVQPWKGVKEAIRVAEIENNTKNTQVNELMHEQWWKEGSQREYKWLMSNGIHTQLHCTEDNLWEDSTVFTYFPFNRPKLDVDLA